MNMETAQQYLVKGCKWGNEKANLTGWLPPLSEDKWGLLVLVSR